jgi:Iap family predicted aminopeptidase
MQLFRYATSVYGQTVMVGASWDLIWWFVGAGAAFIVVHATVKALGRSRANLSEC